MRLFAFLILIAGCTDPKTQQLADSTVLDVAIMDQTVLDQSPQDQSLLDQAVPIDQAVDQAIITDLALDAGPPPDATRPVLDEGLPLDRSVDMFSRLDHGAPLEDGTVVDAQVGPPDHAEDNYEYTCEDAQWVPAACEEGVGENIEALAPPLHIRLPEILEYADHPPATGNHRPTWARWGEYTSLPPQRWIHNLEHGGIVFLYHPCAPAEMVDELRAFIQARSAVQPEPFRYILAPYAAMESAVALVAWEWRYLAPCVRPETFGLFIDRYYRQAPEDVASDGRYMEGWLGR